MGMVWEPRNKNTVYKGHVSYDLLVLRSSMGMYGNIPYRDHMSSILFDHGPI